MVRTVKKISNYIVLLASFILVLALVSAAPSWFGNNVNYPAIEDIAYLHNLTMNVTNPDNESLSFAVDTVQTNITWNGLIVEYANISSWLYIANVSTGMF